MIQVSEIYKKYGTGQTSFHAVQDLSLQVEKGEFVSILGPSGCGKSTLMHIMGGLDRPSAGTVTINEQRLDELSDKQLARFRNHAIGFVFQFFYLIPHMNAVANAMLPLVYGKRSINRKEAAQEVLTDLGLETKYKNKPSQLSGGERQRVAMARALINDPDILLADEPTGNLDSKTGAHVVDLLKKFHKKGKTLVVVTHDEKLAYEADRIIRMKDGNIV